MDGRQLLKQYDHFKEQAQFYRGRKGVKSHLS